MNQHQISLKIKFLLLLHSSMLPSDVTYTYTDKCVCIYIYAHDKSDNNFAVNISTQNNFAAMLLSFLP